MTIKKTYLTNTQEGHAKDYLVKMERVGSKMIVNTEWGKIGADHRSQQVKYEGPDQAAAEQAYQEVLATRVKHGYRIEG